MTSAEFQIWSLIFKLSAISLGAINRIVPVLHHEHKTRLCIFREHITSFILFMQQSPEIQAHSWLWSVPFTLGADYRALISNKGKHWGKRGSKILMTSSAFREMHNLCSAWCQGGSRCTLLSPRLSCNLGQSCSPRRALAGQSGL